MKIKIWEREGGIRRKVKGNDGEGEGEREGDGEGREERGDGRKEKSWG